MPQILLSSNIADDITRNNRGEALQRLANSPASNALLSLLADWSEIKGAEKTIMKNTTAIKAQLLLSK
jgi:hypothetical protein